ncbi:hypothetical protein R1flu_003322 [Riccia fluitans]|uniref:RRM domain-containing protein n=1 Tax=Riccia fluitans TaxID=41844 RepID=A0ABD1YC57_9MARC
MSHQVEKLCRIYGSCGAIEACSYKTRTVAPTVRANEKDLRTGEVDASSSRRIYWILERFLLEAFLVQLLLVEVLKKFFEEHFGTVLDATVKEMKVGDQTYSRGFGFVTFEREKIAQAALQTGAATIHGRKVDIKEVAAKVGPNQHGQDASSSKLLTTGKEMPRESSRSRVIKLGPPHINFTTLKSNVFSHSLSKSTGLPSTKELRAKTQLEVVPGPSRQIPNPWQSLAAKTSIPAVRPTTGRSYASVIRQGAEATVDNEKDSLNNAMDPIPVSVGCSFRSAARAESSLDNLPQKEPPAQAYVPPHERRRCRWNGNEVVNFNNSSAQPGVVLDTTGEKENKNPRSMPSLHDSPADATAPERQERNKTIERSTMEVGSNSKPECDSPRSFGKTPLIWEENFPRLSAAPRAGRSSVPQYSSSDTSLQQSSIPVKKVWQQRFNCPEMYLPQSLYDTLYDQNGPDPKLATQSETSLVQSTNVAIGSQTSSNQASVHVLHSSAQFETSDLELSTHSNSELSLAQTLNKTRALRSSVSSASSLTKYSPIIPELLLQSETNLLQQSWSRTNLPRPTTPSGTFLPQYGPSYGPESSSHYRTSLPESSVWNETSLSESSIHFGSRMPESSIWNEGNSSESSSYSRLSLPESSIWNSNGASTSQSADFGRILQPSPTRFMTPSLQSWNGLSVPQLSGCSEHLVPESSSRSSVVLPEISSSSEKTLLQRWNWMSVSKSEMYAQKLTPQSDPWNCTSMLQSLPASSETFVPQSSSVQGTSLKEWSTYSWTGASPSSNYSPFSPRSEMNLVQSQDALTEPNLLQSPDGLTETESPSTSYGTPVQELSTPSNSGTSLTQSPPEETSVSKPRILSGTGMPESSTGREFYLTVPSSGTSSSESPVATPPLPSTPVLPRASSPRRKV